MSLIVALLLLLSAAAWRVSVTKRRFPAYARTSAVACRASRVTEVRAMSRRVTHPKRFGGDRRRL